MNRLRILSLTTLMLMLASRLPGQPALDDYDSQVGACNEGTISFSVARAYREANLFSADTWEFQGWYNVDPGKCQDIGPTKHYRNGGAFSKDPVTLLAFAFRDSTGTWGSIKIQGGDDRVWHPSNQQFCVQPSEGFGYRRDSSGGDLPRACDGKQTGYQMIPASYEYGGPLGSWRVGFPSNHNLRIKLDSSARATPMGKQPSSGGASQISGGGGGSQSNGGASPGMCGKVSCWDYFAQGVRQAEAQRAAANANHNPSPPQPSTNNLPPPPPPTAAPRPVVSPAPAPPADDPIFLVVMCVAQNLSEKYAYNNPPAGSKMAAFESIAERYIRSVAKPGWEYWIEEAQFENFDAQAAAPEALVSQISPESGRYDTSRPDCPSNYTWYQLPIKR